MYSGQNRPRGIPVGRNATRRMLKRQNDEGASRTRGPFIGRDTPAGRGRAGFASLRDCDFGAVLFSAVLRGLAAFAPTRLAAACFATFVDLMDVLLAIAFIRRLGIAAPACGAVTRRQDRLPALCALRIVLLHTGDR